MKNDKYKNKKYDLYNNNTKYKRDYNDYPGYNNFNTFRDNNSNNYKKQNFINSAKKNINNDTYLEKPKDRKYNYGYSNYNNRQYSQNTYNYGEFQPKKFFGKINKSSNEQYSLKRPYDYKPKEKKENNEKEENSSKQMFFNSKISNNKEDHLKALDSTDDLFIGKYMKYTSGPIPGFNSSNENSLQNMPYISNSSKIPKEKEFEEKEDDESIKEKDKNY